MSTGKKGNRGRPLSSKPGFLDKFVSIFYNRRSSGRGERKPSGTIGPRTRDWRQSIPVSSSERNRLFVCSALAMEMGLSVAAGTVFGYFLDRLFHTDPILTLVFMFVGCAGGVVNFIKLYNLLKKKLDNKE